MDTLAIGALLLAVMLVLLACGVWIGLTLAIVGWVGQAFSSGCEEGGTGFSVTPKIGSPVTRLSRNSIAVLFIAATAGMDLPSFFTVSSTGVVCRSRSQMS